MAEQASHQRPPQRLICLGLCMHHCSTCARDWRTLRQANCRGGLLDGRHEVRQLLMHLHSFLQGAVVQRKCLAPHPALALRQTGESLQACSIHVQAGCEILQD